MNLKQLLKPLNIIVTLMKTNTYLSNLTPLRGIAALLTVIFHADLYIAFFGGTLLNDKTSHFITRMYLMVDFFFVLSGFIMCHVYATHFVDAVNGSNFKRFTIARFARIYPLHLFSLLLTVFIFFIGAKFGIPESPVLQVENSVYSFITNLFLLQSMNLHQWFSFTHASWSISTEWWMYMLFPFLVGPFLRLSKLGRVGIFALCVAGYFLIGYVFLPLVTVPDALSFFRTNTTPPFSLNVSYQFGFLRCLFGFMMGMIVYLGYKDEWGKRFLASGYTFLLLILGLGLCLHFAVLDVFTVLFFPFIILSAAYGSQKLNAILASKPLQRIGDWSFSIYLIHQPFINAISVLLLALSQSNPAKQGSPPPKMGILTSWTICLIFIVFVLLLSYLSYRFIEVPARNWINEKWGKKSIPDSSISTVNN